MSDLTLLILMGIVAIVVFELTVGLRSKSQLRRVGEVLQRNPNVLDVRSGLEFRTGHLPGALNLPLPSLLWRARSLEDRQRPVIVYCASGTRSFLAAFLLRRMGFAEVVDLGPLRNAGKVPRVEDPAETGAEAPQASAEDTSPGPS